MSSRNQLDLDILPEEARKEIEDFYEFLLFNSSFIFIS